jgi:hypothetical protein
MQTVYDIRRQNLRRLQREWHGPANLARKLGHANQSYLSQLAGPNPSRDVSEKVARDIEVTLGLPVGWLDQENPDDIALFDAEILNACVRSVAACLRDAGRKPDPDVQANLVGLVYEHARSRGSVDEAYVQKLVQLTGRQT